MAELFAPSRVGCSMAELPARFYAHVVPRPLTAPRLLHASLPAARLVGLDAAALSAPAFLELCNGQGRLPGVEPICTVYSGHQFGIWAGQLGDGRAHLLGDVTTEAGTWEIQLKGSGRTPYSRMGDGWAVLRSSVREYLASEAMAGLGISTTRALAIVASDDPVVREQMETAAMVTRLAPSFLRFGHFEHWARSAEDQAALLDYVVDHFYPECVVEHRGERDRAATAEQLLRAVMQRTLRLIAQWQLVGFCHGVMNTDNMSVLGLTLDYGPYGFMDAFRADHVCNQSDTSGRYAWRAQPAVARWNLYRLAGTFLVLGCEPAALESCLQSFESEFMAVYREGLAEKFGLDAWRPEDATLEADWWNLLHAQQADFTLAFRGLATADDTPDAWLALFADPAPAQAWLDRYLKRVASVSTRARRARMNRANPLYVLRNHLAQAAIEAAVQGDASEIDRLLQVLRNPFVAQAGFEAYAQPPDPGATPVAVSCSA